MSDDQTAAPVIAQPAKTLKDIAKRLYAQGMRCNCDLDNWEPEQSTGHSCVCRIHKAAFEILREIV